MTSVNDLLDRQPALRPLAAERARQADWLQWLRQVLAPELAAHVRQAVAKNDELTLYVASAAWSNRLRYAVGALHNLLQARDPALSKIRVRVMPP
ncbi:MAG TPA: DciA family protein [Steroidobacteraceae bacterium]